VKEEDKNILIGDNYIAPVTQEFPGLGSAIYILPDQAMVGAAYNANNAQNPTQNLGRPVYPQSEGDTGSVEVFWPCVGASRIVPDYISLFPQSLEVSPFAGATRNLCDRKEVTLADQASALAKFWLFTSAHVAAHFSGIITDDYTSEFDPFSPSFGEKFSPPNLPVSIKDWTGTEISRVYTDQWGRYDGLTYSTWEVNPPNPTGYAPTMMVTCMNDPGTGATPDPLFNPQYSQFCYEIPFMPGQTQYMDTPVVPTSAFAGAGYNNPDCAYPALTPAIKEVDGTGVGPWVSGTGGRLTITALGDQAVPNNAYSGPSAAAAPYNQKTVLRHYGFGAGGTVALVGSDGVSRPLTSVSWSDLTISGNVPSGMPNCTLQQQAQYTGSTAQCGQLIITTANTAAAGQPSNAKQSIDTVTVTIGGKVPTHVAATASIQSAIDAASPGDLIIIDPTCTTTSTAGVVTAVACTTAGAAHTASTHNEMLIMWKPVRLQGVGGATSILNANSHPAGKVHAWRTQVDCLFGLSINASPTSAGNPFDPSGVASCGSTNGGPAWRFFTAYGASNNFNPQVDRLPLEATVGWDAELNGNIAEMLQEPSLMGALEGAAITVLGKGVNFPSNPYDPTLLAGFPAGTTLLTANNCRTSASVATNPFPSNFQCNPSSIDGLGITNSSQGGGAIFIHGWGHNLQIANNRIYNNAGTLSGGINVGQGEMPPATIKGSATNAAPYEGTSDFCSRTVVPTNAAEPYCFDISVNMHHNNITGNSSLGDELFSATPAGAGGASICTGSDYYKFNYNWVCGNLSSGDGGGIGHTGYSYNGAIEHNTVIFNQSTNPTIPANGGGMIIMGAPDADVICSNNPAIDADCVAIPPGSVGPSDGTGPGLMINANLIMGNAAESGSGGGVAFQHVNGADVVAFPTTPANWNSVTFTNNIVSNNVAGWDGAGISLLDSLNVNIINNTIMSNDTTASSGVLFNTLGAPLDSTPPGSNVTCTANCGTASAPQPAGLVSIQNSAILTANLPATITCPPGHYSGTTANNGTCRTVSYPLLDNDVFWQNRDFHISVGAMGAGTLNQQHVVALIPTLNQTSTGQCLSTTNYWDIGVRGDTGPTNHSSTVTLFPTYSVLTNTTGYSGATQHNTTAAPTVVSQYCNGSRIPPEFKASGYQVPPGISDATVPNPIFNLTPNATVDEGNNWINISWGPLAETNPVTGATLGNYTPAAGSSTINYIPASATANYQEAPNTDFFNNSRKNGSVDAGAVEFQSAGGPPVASASLAPSTWSISRTRNCPGTGIIGMLTCLLDPAQTFTLTNTGTTPLTGVGGGVLGGLAANVANYFIVPTGTLLPTCGNPTHTTLLPGATCVVVVQFKPLTAQGPGVKPATISVTDSAGTQTATLSGNALL
jgi:hypothetical protein